MIRNYEANRLEICRFAALNEAIFGQEYSRVKEMFLDINMNFEIDLKDYYLCLTGIEKRFYASRLDKSRTDFSKLYQLFLERLKEDTYMEKIKYEFVIVQYDQSKQFLCFFNLMNKKDTIATKIAEKIHKILCELYEEQWNISDNNLCNVTTYSSRLGSYDLLSPTFTKLSKYQRLSFFLMKSDCLSEELIESMRIPFTFAEALPYLSQIESSISSGDKGETRRLLSELFLYHIRNSFDFELCDDILGEIRKKIIRYSQVFSLDLEKLAREKMQRKPYLNIEELYEETLILVDLCLDEKARYGDAIGPLSMGAIYYIKNNFKKDIGLKDVAASVYVVPSYLSRIFNREMGESIPSYITKLRLNLAVHLLESTDLKISEVGEQVGIFQAQYFGQLFKRNFGMSPSEYRNLHVKGK